jgi:PEP-CTERM motif
MHVRFRHHVRLLLTATIAAIGWLNGFSPAHAETITYSFSGVGNGTAGGNAWSGDFTFVFTGNTANVYGPSSGEYFQYSLGGTFSEGSYSASLQANNIVVVNTDPSFPRLGFYNSTVDNGGTIQNSVFTSYALATALGPITETGPNLLPTFNSNGDGFGTTGGQTIELLGMTSLTFTATVVPEPSSLLLAGLASSGVGAGLIYRRRRRTHRS